MGPAVEGFYRFSESAGLALPVTIAVVTLFAAINAVIVIREIRARKQR